MSGKVYFISDLHLGHQSMAVKRGFSSFLDHDAYIIKCWNSVVGKGDVVWVLGDITMEKSSSYQLLSLLKGYKKVVLGNHDAPQHTKELLKYVNSVCGAVKYKDYILTHIPVHPCEIGRFKGNIHGHVHENSIDDSRYINVSCEVVNYTPKLFESLNKII